MTIYKTTGSGNTTLEQSEQRNVITIMQANHGLYVKLSDADRRELAFELLSKFYDVADDYDPNKLSDVLMLTPKRPKPQVGDLYRVISSDGMTSEWRGNPVVQVTRLFGDGAVWVEQADGHGCRWSAPLDSLEGPITPYAALGFKA